MRRLLLPAAALAALAATGCAATVDRRAVGAKARIDEARWSEAYRCAPEELALAEFHLAAAALDLDDGDGARAYAHVSDAEAAAGLAIARARPCAPKNRPDDLDGDGTANAADLCPELAGAATHGGCPDTDGDLVFDDLDRCRREAEDRDGFRDDDGCPDLDDDDDGIADAFDACRSHPGPVETKGCPDADGDLVADAADRCPKEKGSATSAAGPGCPGAAAAVASAAAAAPATGRVAIGQDRLELKEKLQFQPYAGTLLAASHEVLKELAAVLKAHPQLRVRIEGHTDSKGNAQVNRWMSRERARAVKAFLVKQGVAASRLGAVGRGFSEPVAPNTTEEGREANRRIEFVITSR